MKLLLKKATERHSQMSRSASMGFGCDRHLFCLFKLAEQKHASDPNFPIPLLFSDPAFTALMTDTLCTTNLNIPFIDAMMVNPAFSDFTNTSSEKKGSVTLDKYMNPYSTFEDNVKFVVCSFAPTDVEAFKVSIIDSMDIIKNVILEGENENAPQPASSPTPTPTPTPTRQPTPDMRKVMAKAMADPEVAAAFGNPKLAPITKKIMADPTILTKPDILGFFKNELEQGGEVMQSLAVQLLPKLQKMLKESIPQSMPEKEAGSESSDDDASSTNSLNELDLTDEEKKAAKARMKAKKLEDKDKDKDRDKISDTNSHSSTEVIDSRQTVEKKKKQRVRKVRTPVPTTAAASPDNLSASSRASSPAFSDAYLKEKENEALEEEITRAIAIANRNGDLSELTNLTSLFGEGTLVELRNTIPEARKYLDMVAERDVLKNKLHPDKLTAASPYLQKSNSNNDDSTKANSTTKQQPRIYINADGTPFSKSQINSSKRRVAAKVSERSERAFWKTSILAMKCAKWLPDENIRESI